MDTICVLTARGLQELKEQGGSQAWVLNANKARKCQYVVCVQNELHDCERGSPSAPHHTAFVVGRLREVARSPERDDRWILLFSEYAEISIHNAWSGNRNPVSYTSLEELGIKVMVS